MLLLLLLAGPLLVVSFTLLAGLGCRMLLHRAVPGLRTEPVQVSSQLAGRRIHLAPDAHLQAPLRELTARAKRQAKKKGSRGSSGYGKFSCSRQMMTHVHVLAKQIYQE